MKKTFQILALVSIVLIYSCSSTSKDNESKGTHELQFKNNGNDFTINISDSIVGPLEIKEQSWGATEIKIGNIFQLSITENEGNTELVKSDNASNPVLKLKRYVKEEPSLLFWEAEVTKPEFHFYMTNKLGTKAYTIEDIKGEIFSESDVQSMINAAKTITLKEVNTKS